MARKQAGKGSLRRPVEAVPERASEGGPISDDDDPDDALGGDPGEPAAAEAPAARARAPAARGTSRSGPAGALDWVVANATAIGVFLTFCATVLNVILTSHNKSVLDRTTHAENFAKAFQDNIATITAFIHSDDRRDEESADLALTALDDAAESTDDRIAMLTIGARMLNATECPSSGEATAHFLAAIVTQIRSGRFPESDRLLAYVHSRAFLDLATSDVGTRYDNDDAAGAWHCGPSPSSDPRLRPSPTPTPLPPMLTPGIDDKRNHATIWGEQASWNDAKNQLFVLLRPEPYDGWIHIATWELADRCVGSDGHRRPLREAKVASFTGGVCAPVRVSYTSTPFAFAVDDPRNATGTFWLGRPRFLRDAPPLYYEHPHDSDLRYRGTLGHVIGVIDQGECVTPVGRARYYAVETGDGQRRFEHVWLEVRAAPAGECAATPSSIGSASG